MSPRRTPAIGSPEDVFQSQVRELINKDHVFISAPSLESMEVGETAFGNATESSPSPDSHALYFKPNRDTIVVISFDGFTFSTRFISDTTSTVTIPSLAQTNALMCELLALVALANQHLKVITEVDLKLGEPS